jgi:hypothetical protein
MSNAARIRRCAHRKTNGIPCGSPALKDKPYCYFHDRWREQHIDVENDSFVSGHDFSRAVKNEGFVSGHDFGRAIKGAYRCPRFSASVTADSSRRKESSFGMTTCLQ